MDVRMPFIPEETLRTQRVEIYLNDLKDRLKELRLQHNEVIQNSVDIIKEIDEMSSTLLPPASTSSKSDESISKIKMLIKGFETAKETNTTKAPVTIDSKVNIQKILQNFEQLSESDVLKDSLLLFKQAKESFEKIDTFLGKISATQTKVGTFMETPNSAFLSTNKQSNCANDNGNKTNQAKYVDNDKDMVAPYNSKNSKCSNNSLKSKISMFNGNNSTVMHKESPSHYASCCSSVMSIDTFHSMEDIGNATKSGSSVTNSMEKGYEGDNDDSEYDLLAIKKKKV